MASENNQAAGSDVDEEEKYKKPPSSYGSMKSDSDEMGEKEDYEEGGGGEMVFLAPPDPPVIPVVGLYSDQLHSTQPILPQMMQSQYTETLCTETTGQTKPPGAMVIETGSSDIEDMTEDELEDEDEILVTCSPEPPEPLEMEGLTQADENSQPGRLDPELDLPHIFKTIQNVLTRLSSQELFKFKMWFNKWEPINLLQQVMDGDLLDFVDKVIELYGLDKALSKTISTLESMDKKEEAEELKKTCQKAIFHFYLRSNLFRKCQVLHEGVARAGKQKLLNDVYVEPQISTCGFGGVDPTHEILAQPPTPLQVPSADTFVALNNLFRLQKEDGSPVRTVVTMGVPGSGMSVCVAKFSLDWAQQHANRDLQYIIKLSFRGLHFLRNRNNPEEEMSMSAVMKYYHAPLKDLKLLEEENSRFLIIMDCFDCYQETLDWQNTPVINDNQTKAPIDALVVNVIRGTLLRGACVWILGRRAAVSQIPSEFIDAVTELQGFTDEMKDEYLTKRFPDANLATNIVRHYKRVPMIRILARHPFFCWMVAKLFSGSFQYQGYGANRPRLTPFLIHYMIIQTNRRLRFYYKKKDNELRWTDTEKQLLTRLGKMAFKMLEMNTSVFIEEDLKEVDLQLTEVVIFSGLCTELNPAAFSGRRTFCFSHFTIQEFMAALYVFLMFYIESRNVLDTGFLQMSKLFSSRNNSKSAAGLVQCAVERTLSSQLGRYDMFLRYLCGLLSPHCHYSLLRGFLYSHNTPKVEGLAEVQQVLDQSAQTAPEDRVMNLYECLREMTQEDD
ncbi:hypothetical protein CHARACLAT_006870 [Characodon lateralis]|uniref:Pyrin domain-containing protein n=1 Tax=Characodon lateralis TaxID=208331 RepID=A0ABU7ERH9_9TELE|nr:hypothetical protein [Characodon lateralis]